MMICVDLQFEEEIIGHGVRGIPAVPRTDAFIGTIWELASLQAVMLDGINLLGEHDTHNGLQQEHKHGPSSKHCIRRCQKCHL